jgi:hypothetical protein
MKRLHAVGAIFQSDGRVLELLTVPSHRAWAQSRHHRHSRLSGGSVYQNGARTAGNEWPCHLEHTSEPTHDVQHKLTVVVALRVYPEGTAVISAELGSQHCGLSRDNDSTVTPLESYCLS